MTEIGKRDHDFERAVEGMDEMAVLSMYYAQRNRAESAEQRAQRAEVENARLRDALNDHHQWARTHGHEMGLGYINSWLDGKTQKALATPPPESDPKYERCPSCDGSGLQLNMAGEPDECSDCKGNTVVDAHPTPEQTGSALANLSTLKGEALRGVTTESGRSKVLKCEKNVREALEAPTASGVPYVPDEVRRLPEKFRSDADHAAKYRSYPYYSGKMEGLRTAARRLEAVLASAPKSPTGQELHDKRKEQQRHDSPEAGREPSVRDQTCEHWGTRRTVGDCVADGDCHGCEQAMQLEEAHEVEPSQDEALVTNGGATPYPLLLEFVDQVSEALFGGERAWEQVGLQRTVRKLRSALRDRQRVPDMPEQPSAEILHLIRCMAASGVTEEDIKRGKELQRRFGRSIIPMKLEYEDAAGKYARIREAMISRAEGQSDE